MRNASVGLCVSILGRLAMWKDWAGPYANVIFNYDVRKTPAGTSVHCFLEWEGSVYAPVLLDGITINSRNITIPWPLVKAGEMPNTCGACVYFRRDTQPFGAALWRIKNALDVLYSHLRWRIGWSGVIWGLARPFNDPLNRYSPAESWFWQKRFWQKGGKA